MAYTGPRIPDDDPDYVWIDKSPAELAAELEARKAEIVREWGLTTEEAEEDNDLITAAAQEPRDRTLPMPSDFEANLLSQEGQEALDAWRLQSARAGKKRVLRASLTWEN
jgi:hypothetical protein